MNVKTLANELTFNQQITVTGEAKMKDISKLREISTVPFDEKGRLFFPARPLAATKWQTKLLCQMQRSHGERIYTRSFSSVSKRVFPKTEDVLMRLKSTIAALVPLVTGIALLTIGPAAQAATCTIAFDQGWGNIFNYAKDTFAVPTMWNSDGQHVQCPSPVPNTDTGTCYTYRQACVPGRTFTVFPQQHGHFHASFDDPTINCISSGGFGRKQGGKCVKAAWWAEPRFLQSHAKTHWVEIAHKDFSGNWYTFSNLQSISVGSQPIQLWYKKPDGSVWGWSNLGANTNHPLNTGPTIAVWISGAEEATGPYTIYSFIAST